jgi:hypothetical protein
MHFEILVEDTSGKIALEHLVPKILGPDAPHSYRIHPYKGIGRLPPGLKNTTDPRKRILLDQLPRVLSGYGKSLQPPDQYGVVVVVDSDRKNCRDFKTELLGVLDKCHPAPRTLFRIAIEEMEAWLLGDRHAITTAFPKAKTAPLDTYTQDSICGTWEVLADAVYPGGAEPLKKRGFPHTGQAKCEWAAQVAPHMDVDANKSRSFNVFKQAFEKLAN